MILSELTTSINLLIKENPILAGAVGLYGAGLLTWILRNVPEKIFNLIYKQLTTSVIFSNASSDINWQGGENNFIAFMKWFSKSKYKQYSRSLSLTIGEDDEVVVSLGFGHHFFFFNNHLYWVHKSKLDSSGSTKEKHQIEITVLGRDHNLIYDLVDAFKYKKSNTELSVRFWDTSEWGYPIYIYKRNINTVIVNIELKNRIINNITNFIENPEWYHSKGLAYKLIYILHGKPGTGKTSFVKALSSYFNRNIYSINLASMSDSSFIKALNTIPPNSFLLIEDFDSSSAVKSRDINNSDNKDLPILNLDKEFSFLTLSTVLNTLDGIVSLNNLVVFMTTNHLEKIDPAVLRKGRVNYIEEIKALSDKEIKEYIKLVFPDNDLNKDYIFKDINGCDLEGLFIDHKNDFNNFINSIPKYES